MQQLNHQWNAELYNEKHSFVYEYGTSLIDLLAPKPAERILDIGCGSGELTVVIAALTSEVIGMDLSPSMVQKARTQFPSLSFRIGDASNFKFEKQFDAIFSNATLHWVPDYKKAARCMYDNLVLGGRVVVEFGGKHNVQAITDRLRSTLRQWGYTDQAALNIWYFPSIGAYTSVLESVGFKVTFAQWYDRPTELVDEEEAILDWLSMFAKPFFKGVADKDCIEIKNEVQKHLAEQLFSNGKWYADYKRIRVVAYK